MSLTAAPHIRQVSYVLDTEDVFRRPRRQQGAAGVSPNAAAAKTDKFREWVEEHARQRRIQYERENWGMHMGTAAA